MNMSSHDNRPNPDRLTSPRRRTGTRKTPRRFGAAVVLASLGLVGVSCSSDSKSLTVSSSAERPATTEVTDTTLHDHTTDAPEHTDPPTKPTEATDPTTESSIDTPASTTTTTPEAASGAIMSIDEAQSGSIQIEAKGSLRDPEFGTYTSGSRGSGFFISPDGLAVTNNHVVTGAATLEVYVGGDTTKSYNARVLGVSECNDLAVIKVSTPDEVPYFEWFENDVRAGLDVYAAGFPLGDPEFTLTKGIVAKAKAGGDLTGTSSIDHTIEHDAAIQPGSSGGPLLGAGGEIVGVNYAGGAREVGAQYYAISADLAEDVVEQLAEGDFESIGLNGYAIADDESGITGIWVSGVAPGTPASEAGLVPGDIITSMNGLPVGTDGTFKDYCDVIRTAGDRPIAVEVLRFDTQELLKGEINGNQVLTTSVFFGEEMAETAGVEEGAAYTTYVPITDDTGTLTLEVPAEWAQVDSAPIDDGSGNIVPRIQAATDLDAFINTFDAPGVQFAALPAAAYAVDDVLASFAQSNCTDAGINAYDDGAFVGKYQLWENCGGTNTLYVVLATNSTSGSPTTYLTTVQAVTTADLDALDHILATFNASA